MPHPIPSCGTTVPNTVAKMAVSAETPTQGIPLTIKQNLETLLSENAQTQALPCPTPSVAPPLCGRAQAGANRFSGLTDTWFYPILSMPRLPRRDSKRHIIGVSGGGSKANWTSPPAYNRCRPCLRQANNQWRDAGAGSCCPNSLAFRFSSEAAGERRADRRGLEWRSLRIKAASFGDVILSRGQPRPAPPRPALFEVGVCCVSARCCCRLPGFSTRSLSLQLCSRRAGVVLAPVAACPARPGLACHGGQARARGRGHGR